jgi:uncharacterized membrane protein
MSQPDATYEPQPAAQQVVTRNFPWQRLFLSVMYAVIAWAAFWVLMVLAVVMWVLVALNREPHEQFRRFAVVGARYVGQCLGYVLLISDEKPFPLGPFPAAE